MAMELVKRQVNFQKNMKSNSEEMFLALVEELGEFVASIGYATWKQVTRDEANMDIELVDIAVFAINEAYYSGENYEPMLNYLPISEFDLVQFIIAALAQHDFAAIYTAIFNYNPKLKDVLTAKQALNQLRQDYGYKTGDYIKDWNGKEDNAYLIGFYGQAYEDIYAGMEKIYTEKIIGSRLVNVND